MGTSAVRHSRNTYLALLRIESDSLDMEELARNIDLKPTRSWRKGEPWFGGQADRAGDPETRVRSGPLHEEDAWIYIVPVPQERPPAEHLDALWGSIQHAAGYLRSLRGRASVRVWLQCTGWWLGSRYEVDEFEVPPRTLEMFAALDLPLGVCVEPR